MSCSRFVLALLTLLLVPALACLFLVLLGSLRGFPIFAVLVLGFQAPHSGAWLLPGAQLPLELVEEWKAWSLRGETAG